MSKLVVNEITSIDDSPVDFPDGITINGANLDVGAYELTQADIDNATTTKGLVSGEQLAGLGGGGGAVKTILLRDDGAGGSTWQHLISSADLTDGDDFIFILGSSSSADLNVVCIPTEADVPELANISELKLVVYGGSGKSGFSENFNGVGTGAQVLGTEGVAGSGCVIARKVGLDTWYLSYEVTKPSGPEVLKDWTSVSEVSTNLLDGIDFGVDGFDNVEIHFRNLQVTKGQTLSTLRFARTGKDMDSLYHLSLLFIVAAAASGRSTSNNLLSPFHNNPTQIIGNNIGNALYTVANAVVKLNRNSSWGGGNSKLSSWTAWARGINGLTTTQSSDAWVGESSYSALSTDNGSQCTELWLDFDPSTAGFISYQYKILRNA